MTELALSLGLTDSQSMTVLRSSAPWLVLEFSISHGRFRGLRVLVALTLPADPVEADDGQRLSEGPEILDERQGQAEEDFLGLPEGRRDDDDRDRRVVRAASEELSSPTISSPRRFSRRMTRGCRRDPVLAGSAGRARTAPGRGRLHGLLAAPGEIRLGRVDRLDAHPADAELDAVLQSRCPRPAPRG